MKIVEKDGLRILTPAKGKLIRLIDDLPKEAEGEESAYTPYYTDKVYLSVSIKDEDIDKLYVEEKVGD